MDEAVVMAAAAQADMGADGMVLMVPQSSPATPHTTYPIQNWTLKVATHMLPSLKLAESRSGMRLSDNIDMLRAHRSDPLAMNETRVDALWGLTNLMDRAMAGAARLPGPTLLRRLAGTFTSYSIERAGIC